MLMKLVSKLGPPVLFPLPLGRSVTREKKGRRNQLPLCRVVIPSLFTAVGLFHAVLLRAAVAGGPACLALPSQDALTWPLPRLRDS